MTFLQGYKTYILAGLALVVLTLGHFAILSVDAVNAILPFLGFGAVLTLRSALNQSV